MEERLVYLAGILALGIAAQWLAWRLRLPAILLLLLFGFAAGQFTDPDLLIGRDLLVPIVSLSVAVILFEGGLSLQLAELRETGQVVFRLVTVGIVVTWLLTATFAWLLLGFDVSMALLTGAILVVSGPTVVVPLLRHIRPVRRIGSIVKWEGIVNDPIGAVLAVLVFEALRAGGFRPALTTAIGGLVATATVGIVLGLGIAWLLILLLRRYWVPDYLQNAVFLTAVVVAYTASNLLQPESGLVTVTVLGLALANQKAVTVRHVIEFKENLRVLLISTLFILLASRIELSDLTGLGFSGAAFLLLLLFVVRPLAVLLSTLGTETTVRERLFLGWIAPRGIVAAAVSSFFALNVATLAGDGSLSPAMVAQAEKLVPITFLVIVGTVAVYGLTAAPLARYLGIAEGHPQGILFAGADSVTRAIASAVQKEGYSVLLVDTNYRNVAEARMAGIPAYCASIVSEFVREELDLGGIGRLLAMTPNSEVNALATLEFSDVFERAEIYQLAREASEGGRQQPMPSRVQARSLFGEEVTFRRLVRRFAAGAVVKKTPLTEEFDFQAWREMYGESAIVLFLIEDSGDLSILTADRTASPKPGQTLIALVDPTEEETPPNPMRTSA